MGRRDEPAHAGPSKSLAPRPILPSFLVLAAACLGMCVGSNMGVNLSGCMETRTKSCLTPRIVFPSLPQARLLRAGHASGGDQTSGGSVGAPQEPLVAEWSVTH